MTAMRMKMILKTGLTIAALALAPVTASRADTLTDTLISAYHHSGLLEQNRALLRAADEDVAQSVASLRPVVRYVVSSGYSSAAAALPGSDGLSASIALSADLLLYDFGRSQLGIDLAKENVLILRDALVGVEQSVLLRAVAAFMNVQRDGAIVGLRENNVRLITQELRAAEDRFEVGEITRTDVAIAQARLAAARSAQAAAMGNLARSREEYRAAVGNYPGQLAAPPRPPATATSQAGALDTARRRHPDMLQAQRRVSVAELGTALAKVAMKPTLTGSAGVSVDEDGDDNTTLGLRLSGPIYQGGQLASAYRQAAAQVDSARAALHITRHGVDQNVGNAWATLAVADAALRSSEQQIRAATVAFRGVREEAQLGARTTLDVLNAEQELLDARANKIAAETDRYIAVYNLLSSMGLLTADHLRLGIATYDPAAYYNAVKTAPTYKVSPQGKRLDHVLKALGKN